jgi:acyl dehydratase
MVEYTDTIGFRNPIHYGGELAKKSTFGGPIASGPLLACLLDDVMLTEFGAAWLTAGKVNIAFIGPVRPDDEVTLQVSVTSAQPADGREEYVLDVACQTQAGTAVMAGTASISVPGRGNAN